MAKLRTTKQREFGIPIYTKEELINAGEHVLSGFYYDAYWHGMKNSLPNASIEVFRNLPTSGIRFRDEGSFYSMYDIDGEYRLFVFFSEQNNYLSPVGYPVIVKQPLAYEAFSSINIGDKAEAVITVDPGSELVIERILTINEYDEAEAVFQYNEKCGKTVSTLHYLTDGVLRIDYGLNEAGDVVIEAMTYGADWKLANAGGVIIDYRILPEDLDF